MTSVLRVERHVVRDERDARACHVLCRNVSYLYDRAVHVVKRELGLTKKWLRYQDLYQLLKDHPDSRALPAQTTQQLLRKVDHDFRSFFASVKSYTQDKTRYEAPPRPPGFKDLVQVSFTNQQVKKTGNVLRFPKNVGLRHLRTKTQDVREVRVIPTTNCFVVEVVYRKEVQENKLVS